MKTKKWRQALCASLKHCSSPQVFIFDAQTCPTKKQRVALLEDWVEHGGVLLSTYNMYQLYVVDDDIKPKPSAKVECYAQASNNASIHRWLHELRRAMLS